MKKRKIKERNGDNGGEKRSNMTQNETCTSTWTRGIQFYFLLVSRNEDRMRGEIFAWIKASERSQPPDSVIYCDINVSTSHNRFTAPRNWVPCGVYFAFYGPRKIFKPDDAGVFSLSSTKSRLLCMHTSRE